MERSHQNSIRLDGSPSPSMSGQAMEMDPNRQIGQIQSDTQDCSSLSEVGSQAALRPEARRARGAARLRPTQLCGASSPLPGHLAAHTLGNAAELLECSTLDAFTRMQRPLRIPVDLADCPSLRFIYNVVWHSLYRSEYEQSKLGTQQILCPRNYKNSFEEVLNNSTFCCSLPRPLT